MARIGDFCRHVRAKITIGQAHIAQLVEHVLGKDEVIGSNPIVGSTGEAAQIGKIEIES